MLTLTKKSFMARLKPLNQSLTSEPRITLCYKYRLQVQTTLFIQLTPIIWVVVQLRSLRMANAMKLRQGPYVCSIIIIWQTVIDSGIQFDLKKKNYGLVKLGLLASSSRMWHLRIGIFGRISLWSSRVSDHFIVNYPYGTVTHNNSDTTPKNTNFKIFAFEGGRVTPAIKF